MSCAGFLMYSLAAVEAKADLLQILEGVLVGVFSSTDFV